MDKYSRKAVTLSKVIFRLDDEWSIVGFQYFFKFLHDC